MTDPPRPLRAVQELEQKPLIAPFGASVSNRISYPTYAQLTIIRNNIYAAAVNNCAVAAMRLVSIGVLALALTSATAAFAEPGLGEKVYDPYVKNGVTELEVRGAQLQGGAASGEAAAVVELEHGFGDRFSFAVLGEFEKHVGEPKKLDAVALEGVAYLGKIPGTEVDVGAYLEYEQRIHNESGVGEAKLLLAKSAGNFQALVNLVARKAFTSRPGEGRTELGYAAAATWELAPRFRAGVEAFGDLGTAKAFGGRQASYVGPKIMWEARPAGSPRRSRLRLPISSQPAPLASIPTAKLA